MRFPGLARVAPLLVLLSLAAPVAAQVQDGIYPAPRTVPLRPDFNPLTVTVSLVLAGQPSNQQFRVYFVDEARLPQINRRPDDYRLAEIPTPSWVSLSAGGGVTPSAITFTADFNQFAEGQTRTALCVFQEDTFLTNEVFTKEVRVEAVNVQTGSLQPRIEPAVVSFEDSSGGQQQLTQTLTVSAQGAGQFSYAFEILPQSAQQWLTINPPFAAYNGQPIQHTLTATLLDLPQGTYNAQLRMTHDGQGPSLTVPITAELLGTPVMTVSPTRIEAIAKQFKENPPTQEIRVGNSGGGVISYTVTANQPWVQITPASGQAGGGGTTPHTVLLDAMDLPVGTYNALITVAATGSSVEGGLQTIPVEVDVFPGGTAEAQPEEGFLFTAAPGSSEPLPGVIGLTSPELDDLRWTARVEPSTAGFVRLLTRSGAMPGALRFEIDPSNIGRAIQLGAAIVIDFRQAPDAAALGEETPQGGGFELELRVPVTLQAREQAASLAASPASVELIARESDPRVRVQPLRISASGGAPERGWRAEARAMNGAGWLTLSAVSGVTPATVEVRADPAGLEPGVYRGEVAVISDTEEAVIQVGLLVVESGRPLLAVGQAGVALRGTGSAQTREVRIVNLGDGAATWNAVVTEKTPGNWADTVRLGSERLQVVSSGAAVGLGVQRGLIEVSSPQADNSPQYLSLTYEKQDALTAVPQFQFDPGGLVFTAQTGEAPPTRKLNVRGTFAGQTRLQFASATDDGGDWLRARTFTQLGDPIEEGSNVLLRTNGPVELTVTADPSGLAPGVYRGRVVVGVAEERSGSVPVTLIVRDSACQPSRLVMTVVQPADDFRGVAGRPVGVEADLRDNCGDPVATGGVTATGGGASAALLDVGGGRFEGAWVPMEASGERTPTALRLFSTGLTAAGGGLVPDQGWTVGWIAANNADWIAASPPVHGATFLLGQPLAPGSIASVFGQDLAGQSLRATATPLPHTLDGLEVRIGGAPAPLYFVSEGQANLQIPSEAPLETRLQSVVKTPSGYALPQSFLTAAAQPGVFPVEGRAIVINQDGSLNAPGNPARVGEVVVVYLTGQGRTQPMPASGLPAPAMEPFARVTQEASIRIGGVEGEIAFLGLTPGFVGLTQGNVILLEGTPAGDAVDMVVEIGGHASPPLPVAIAP